MAAPTLAAADAYLTNLLKETATGGQFGTAQRYRAIYMVANRIQWVTHVYTTEATTVSLANGTTSYNLQTLLSDTNLTWDRIERMWISGYDPLIKYTNEDEVRSLIAAGAGGRPLGYFALKPCTLLIDLDPDDDYDLIVRRAPEIPISFTESTPASVSINVPDMWLFGGLDVGAWWYLTRTQSDFDYGARANTEFEDWLASLQAQDDEPDLLQPNIEYFRPKTW